MTRSPSPCEEGEEDDSDSVIRVQVHPVMEDAATTTTTTSHDDDSNKDDNSSNLPKRGGGLSRMSSLKRMASFKKKSSSSRGGSSGSSFGGNTESHRRRRSGQSSRSDSASVCDSVDSFQSYENDFASELSIAEDDDDDDNDASSAVGSHRSLPMSSSCSSDNNASSSNNNVGGSSKLPKKWIPSSSRHRSHHSHSLNIKKSSSSPFFHSFTRHKKAYSSASRSYTAHSMHPAETHLSELLEDSSDHHNMPLHPNSDHNEALTELIRETSGDTANSTAEVHEFLRRHSKTNLEDMDDDDLLKDLAGIDDDDEDENDHTTQNVLLDNMLGVGSGRAAARRSSLTRRSSNNHLQQQHRSSKNSSMVSRADSIDIYSLASSADDSNTANNNFLDSHTMLERLGDRPSKQELANIAAIRAKEYIEEVLETNVTNSNRATWDGIPQYTKRDLLVGQYLGKGTFSDVFEVIATVEEEKKMPSRESWKEDGKDLDALLENKFNGSFKSLGSSGISKGSDRTSSKERKENAKKGTAIDVSWKEETADDLDKEIDAMFGHIVKNEEDLDKEIDAMFGTGNPSSTSRATPKTSTPTEASAVESFRPQKTNRRRRGRHNSDSLGQSVCLGTHDRRQSSSSSQTTTRRVIMAMKCLRPQIRSDADQFLIGVEDLVSETAMLASLHHPNIVKLHGRAGGCVSSDGYFILLDRLQDTLDDRIQRWKKANHSKDPPGLSQIRSATAIADALSYLHSKRIVFRDLKPANVGFDSAGTLKLFDFGFATRIDDESADEENDSVCGGSDNSVDASNLLYDKCGTPRYMAPEVGLEEGYALPADVYSFGILLWEICALKKPFGQVRTADEFQRTVFERGTRPKLSKHWPEVLKKLTVICWSAFPRERPEMSLVKSMLAAHARELSSRNGGGQNHLRKSIYRRLTG